MKILFAGDLVPTATTEGAFIRGETEPLFGTVLPLIKSADRTFINLECALTETDGAIRKMGPNLKASPACAAAIKAAGITDVLLSNNHVFDYGVKGLADTVSALDRAGLPYTGIGENNVLSRKAYRVEQDGKSVAIVNVCEHEYSYALPDRVGANPFDPFLTMEDIRAAKKDADFVVVVYHGGKEFCAYPSPRLVDVCRAMVRNGADIVLTQHSHCIGCYEEYEGGHILYGQGNFHFCWEGRDKSWNEGLVVEASFGQTAKIAFYPTVADEKKGITLAEGAQKQEILNAFYARNRELQDGRWRDGWRAFCTGVKEGYQNVLLNFRTREEKEEACEMFAHYLDCEAHSDVWRELFQTWQQTNEKENI